MDQTSAEYLNEIDDEARDKEEDAQWQDHQGRWNHHRHKQVVSTANSDACRNERKRRRQRNWKGNLYYI